MAETKLKGEIVLNKDVREKFLENEIEKLKQVDTTDRDQFENELKQIKKEKMELGKKEQALRQDLFD